MVYVNVVEVTQLVFFVKRLLTVMSVDAETAVF
jgi:hypothetical protein